jgi:hypothetical protein
MTCNPTLIVSHCLCQSWCAPFSFEFGSLWCGHIMLQLTTCTSPLNTQYIFIYCSCHKENSSSLRQSAKDNIVQNVKLLASCLNNKCVAQNYGNHKFTHLCRKNSCLFACLCEVSLHIGTYNSSPTHLLLCTFSYLSYLIKNTYMETAFKTTLGT